MNNLTQRPAAKTVVLVVVLAFINLQFAWVLPDTAHATSSEDLKRIEYKYYFRGNYTKAIEELSAFLERDNLTVSEITEAREYLAASFVLSGSTTRGKAQYIELLKMDSGYDGPDPSVFKSIVIATYEEARADFASAVIRNVPDTQIPDAGSPVATDTEAPGKPLYKKWWFYATMGAVLIIIAGAAAGGGDESTPTDTGRVTVEVGIR